MAFTMETNLVLPGAAAKLQAPTLQPGAPDQGQAGRSDAPAEEPMLSATIVKSWISGGYAGTVRCGLPLPLANECLGEVVLQHPSPAQAGALLDECARVLVEGGRLWLFLANPWSPYRLRSVRDLPASASGPGAATIGRNSVASSGRPPSSG